MPNKDIPSYLGKDPDGTKVTFTGHDEELDLAFESGEEVLLLVRGRAKAANFKENQFGALTLQQQIKVSHALVVEDEELWNSMRAEMKRRDDAAIGQESLDAELDGEEDETE